MTEIKLQVGNVDERRADVAIALNINGAIAGVTSGNRGIGGSLVEALVNNAGIDRARAEMETNHLRLLALCRCWRE